MDWFLYDNGLRHERVKRIRLRLIIEVDLGLHFIIVIHIVSPFVSCFVITLLSFTSVVYLYSQISNLTLKKVE